MGIRHLTKFVDTNYARWERGRRVRGDLVVDGNCILHSLHTMEWSNGGQYREFRNAVIQFYSKLLDSGITPIVVFDGVDEAQKNDTLLKRKQEWVDTIHKRITDNVSRQARSHGRILPPLTSEVYRMALYGLGIQFYVADGEADVVTARLANYYRCPVLSLDSDFFVFRLVGGFIHFNRFYFNSRVVTADVYHRDQFADQLRLRDESLFCLIPAIVGNDFMVPCTLAFVNRMVHSVSNTGSASSHIQAICRHLSCFSSIREFTELSFGGKKLEPRCQKALEWYEVPKDLSCKELASSTDLRHHNGARFPDWLVRLFHQGRLPSSVMDAAISSQAIFRVVADSFKRESSMLAGQLIRRHMYALLEVETVVEVVRCGLTVTGVKTTRLELGGMFRGVTVASLESLGHQQRQSLFYEILKCDKLSIDQKLTQRYQDWRFVAATLSFWARTTCPPEPLVRALLLCFTLCSLPDEKFNTLNRRLWRVPLDFRQSQEWLDTLHWLSQWQTIYHTVWTLNALLKEPMWVFSPAFLYDGELAMYLTSSTDTSQWLSKVDTTLYNCLEKIVLSARLVTPPYDSEDSASIEAVSCNAELRCSSTQQSICVESVDERQRPGNAQSTQSQQVNVPTHLTQETTYHREQQGAATESTPSPQVIGGKSYNHEVNGEQHQKAGDHRVLTETPSIDGGFETTAVGSESAAQNGTTAVKPKKKNWRRNKVQTNTDSIEVASSNGASTNTPDKHQIDKTQNAEKKPAELKHSAAAATISTTGTNPTTSKAKRKRNRSKQKKAETAQNEMPPQEGQSGNCKTPAEKDNSLPECAGVQTVAHEPSKEELKAAEATTLPQQESATTAASAKRRRKRHRRKPTTPPPKEEPDNPAASPSTPITRGGSQTLPKSAPQKSDGPPEKSEEVRKNQTVHIPRQQNTISHPSARKSASGHSGAVHVTSGGASLRGRQDPRQHSQTSPKSTGRPQASQGPTQASFKTSGWTLEASKVGSRQPSVREDLKSPVTPPQGRGQQPLLSNGPLSANAKQRKYTRRQQHSRKQHPSEACTATNTT